MRLPVFLSRMVGIARVERDLGEVSTPLPNQHAEILLQLDSFSAWLIHGTWTLCFEIV